MPAISPSSRYGSRSARYITPAISAALSSVVNFARSTLNETPPGHVFAKREELPKNQKIAFGILIPVLVLLSGLFAGLMLGYMSLDETQLHVLSQSGTPKQKEYAKKIMPLRKNGHLLLITLILANMIVNETLPIIADPVLGGGVQGVVVSTVLIVIFSEIIPQSICTRYGLAIGATMAVPVQMLIYALGIISWPVAKIMELLLGEHHGVMYRRAELKELITLHAIEGHHGGDLHKDTVHIIGATLDLQEKVVKEVMTPIDKVFMLSIDTKLDHDTMKKIYDSGHSRVPIYEEINVQVMTEDAEAKKLSPVLPLKSEKVKKIVGILLVKQCLMLNPQDATPIKSLRLNPVLNVALNTPLLQMLNKFQEGNSHMVIVSRHSEQEAEIVKREVKKGLRRRLKEKVGIDSDGSSSESEDENDEKKSQKKGRKSTDKDTDVEKGSSDEGATTMEEAEKEVSKPANDVQETEGTKRITWERITRLGREQNIPDDAVPPKEGVKEWLQMFDPNVVPLGIITLEDVLEELIGEEILDEFDTENQARLSHYTTEKPKESGSEVEVVQPSPKLDAPEPTSDVPTSRTMRSIAIARITKKGAKGGSKRQNSGPF